MNHALWLLMRLRFKGWLRRLGANLQTVRGALLTAFVGLLIFIWFVALIAQAITRSSQPPTSEGWAERIGPFVLLLYCVWSVASSSSQGSIQFTLPEVQFLFAGPFSRRQILTYKLLSQTLLNIPISLFISVAGRSMMGTWVGGWIGAFLILTFIQMFSVAIFLLGHAIELHTYSRLRQVLLGIVLIGFVGALISAWRSSGGIEKPFEILQRAEASPLLQYGLAPLRWFFRVLSATQLDGTFALHVGLTLAINGLLFFAVLRLDSHYLETAATVAEKKAVLLERIRSGGLANAVAPKPGQRVRTRWPNPPWLAGVGPIFWRQLIGAWRNHRVFTFLLFTTLLALGGMIFSILFSEKGIPPSLPWTVASVGLVVSLMLNQAVAFDFRADLDRIDFLKSLPLSSWQVSIAELLVPTFALSVYQILFTIVVFVVLEEIGPLVLAVTMLSWPVNLLLVGIENALFLLFPSRVAPATPGDFSQAFRQMLTMFAKVIAMAIALAVCVATGAVVNWLTGGNRPFTVLATWAAAVLISLLPIPLVAYAYDRFDVSRDTPP